MSDTRPTLDIVARVEGQRLRLIVPRGLVDGSLEYIRFVLQADAAWAGLDQWMNLKGGAGPEKEEYHVALRDGATEPLPMPAGRWDVCFWGEEILPDGKIGLRIITNPAAMTVYPSGVTTEVLPELAPSAAEQIAAKASHAEQVAQSVRDDADRGIFDGGYYTVAATAEGDQLTLTFTGSESGMVEIPPQTVTLDIPGADPADIAKAVEDYLLTHPVTAPVQSVNGQTGAVNLTAADVQADPAGAAAAVAEALGRQIAGITVPTKLSDLTADAQHRTVTDAEKTEWSGKADKTTTEKAIRQLNESKADLVDGKVPESQLPTGMGGGLSQTEKDLMMSLFKNTPYTADMSSTIKNLESIWGGGSGAKYTITYNLLDVVAEPKPVEVSGGTALKIHLTPTGGNDINEVSIIMGGVDITGQVYNEGYITITAVSGDITINANASKSEYRAVEYIECADKMAYLKTGHKLQPEETVEFSYLMPKSYEGYAISYVVGASINDTAWIYCHRGPQNVANQVSFGRRKGDYNSFGTTIDNPVPLGNKASVKETVPGTIQILDGNVLKATVTDPNVSTQAKETGPMMVFNTSVAYGGPSGNSALVGMRFYGLVVRSQEGNIVANFVPAIDIESKPALYNTVDKTYHYGILKSGEPGGIIAGPEV